jgi:hypothetical protein
MSVARTITFTPAPTVVRENISATQGAGAQGFQHLFNPTNRPVYQFTLDMGPLTRSEAENLSAQHALHQGGKTFMWDGGQFGSMADYDFIALADGVRKDFFLPNRNIGQNSFSAQTYRPTTQTASTWAGGAYTLRGASGVITFASAPFSGDFIRAKYGCTYRVKFPTQGIRLDQFGPGLYNAQLVLTEHPTLVASEAARTTFYQVVLAANVAGLPRMVLHRPLWKVTLGATITTAPNITPRRFAAVGRAYGVGLYNKGTYPGSVATGPSGRGLFSIIGRMGGG